MRNVVEKLKAARENISLDKNRRREIVRQCSAATDRVIEALGKRQGKNGKKNHRDIRPLLSQQLGE